MTTSVPRGTATTLLVEWREYAGGPYSTVTGTTITITRISDSAVVLATTATGVLTPSTGINAYVWTSSASLAVGQYLATWSCVDSNSEVVQATEVLDITAGAVLGGPYATRARLKRRMGIPDSNTVQDSDIDDELLSASRAINLYCHRQFGRVDTASERSYVPDRTGINIDDAYSLDGMLVAGSAYDTATTTPEPLDGIRDGMTGWPYERLSIPVYSHPIYRSTWTAGALVAVTALWGWASVPEDIESACLMLAADGLKSKDAPFGVAGFGDYAVRVRANPKAQELLTPYIRDRIPVAG